MNPSISIETQLLATKFFVPTSAHTLISRPRLTSLLQQSLKYPLTLISAPAGFGKTCLLSAWSQSLPPSHPLVAWVSLDEGDNEPRLFWTYVLEALNMQQPERFTPLVKYLQSPQVPSLEYVLTRLTDLLADSGQHFLLILDDYHVITEQQVHTTLSYLIEHLPTQLHIILATRVDPALLLSQLQTRGQILEVRAKELRCTIEETGIFFKEAMGIQFPKDTIQQVTARTEGWLVGLQLLGLSLPDCADPIKLLEEVSGDQRYILDFLTDEVLRRQPQDVQTFLLCTSVLERLNASLCDAVIEQTASQQMLQRLEQANLFVMSLDSKKEWYRYHALFAEALRYRMEQTQGDLVPILHHRASLWYAEHHDTTKAILHAFNAHQWQWAADLIERMPSMLTLTWGVDEHELILLRHWLEQLPRDVVRSRPHLCLACAQLLWMITPHTILEAWLDSAEATLTASLTRPTHEDVSDPTFTLQARQEQENLLGEVIVFRAIVRSYREDGQAALPLCQQASALLSADNYLVRAQAACAQLWAYYSSATNDAATAIQNGLQAVSLAQATGQATLILAVMSSTVMHMIGTGQLYEAYQLTQQGMQLRTQSAGFVLPAVGWPMLLQADILREWNQLDAALALVEEAISLCKQTASSVSLFFLLCGYAVLLRVHLSRGDLDAARSALQEFERIGLSIDQDFDSYVRSHFTTIDQIRLWLASGKLDRATRWAQELEVRQQYGTSFARERTEVACIRLLLAKEQPDYALERLESVLARATTAQRWDHVIETSILQALAYQMLQQETQALEALAESVRLAEPQGYIRRFADEGTLMAALLSKLREQQRKTTPTPYLDTLLAAFPQQSKVHKRQPKRRARNKILPQ